jgi:hypothetical protein
MALKHKQGDYREDNLYDDTNGPFPGKVNRTAQRILDGQSPTITPAVRAVAGKADKLQGPHLKEKYDYGKGHRGK